MLFPFHIFLSLALGFTIVYFIIPRIIKVSRVKGIFDQPNHRSAASHATPSLGGIAIFVGFILSLIISTNSLNINHLKYLMAGITCMFVVGLKDDFIGCSARKKLIIELIMAIYLVTLGHFRITNLHGILGIHEIGYISAAILSVIAIVGIINAVNLIDGIDGLASGVGILISTVYGYLFLSAGDYVYALTCFSLTGSLIAFFLYNVFGRSNKIFMGDTGSLVLGTIIAILTIHFNELPAASGHLYLGHPVLSFVLIIVPVTDTLRVFAIRLYHGKSPFSADMNHIHHLVLRLTRNHLTSSLIIITVNAALILLAFGLIDKLGNNYLFLLLFVLAFILASIPPWLLKRLENSDLNEHAVKSVFSLSVFHAKKKEF